MIKHYSLEDTQSGRVTEFDGFVISLGYSYIPSMQNYDYTITVRIHRLVKSSPHEDFAYVGTIVKYEPPPGGSGKSKIVSRIVVGPCSFAELDQYFSRENEFVREAYHEALMRAADDGYHLRSSL